MCKQKLSVFSATEEKDLNDTEQNFLVHSTDSTSNDRYTQIIYLKEIDIFQFMPEKNIKMTLLQLLDMNLIFHYTGNKRSILQY